MSGRHVMRWDCNKGGPAENCFNRKRRLKFEVFAGCFPRGGNFTDVDALAEIGGAFSMLEWKDPEGSVTRGQDRAYRQFTLLPRNVVYLVEGDAELMTVSRYRRYWNGQLYPWREADLTTMLGDIKGWVDFAERPVPG